jgi:hypothetical protein
MIISIVPARCDPMWLGVWSVPAQTPLPQKLEFLDAGLGCRKIVSGTGSGHLSSRFFEWARADYMSARFRARAIRNMLGSCYGSRCGSATRPRRSRASLTFGGQHDRAGEAHHFTPKGQERG